ncbi:pyrroline-5-carboxylate reductase [Kiloniella laminariae]|uniref:pyrroline-5-carboxylate reductase n=1 Tax=Kiloniella laminariae TaxID=454162 RepID=UPI000373CDBA|nr:pyrroline-5-carboxylate reductase [Kiloniella laminariae]
MLIDGPLLLIGCGKMGGALLQGWLDRGLPGSSVTVVDPSARASYMGVYRDQGVVTLETLAEVPKDFSPVLVMFAVKPQMIDSTIGEYRRFVRSETVFLSVVAGKKISFFEEKLGKGVAVIRTMPNTPAAVSRGMTVLFANQNVDENQQAACGELMAAVGEIAWLDQEEHIDAVTGVSGSGPAYIFFMAECLAQAGIDAGLPEALARKLADTTVSGAGELIHQSKESPSQLRINVTSPNGTTQAALEVLMSEDGLQPLVTKAVAAATSRSRELS